MTAHKPPSGGSQPLQSHPVHVSSAEILLLEDSPVEIIPAQGPGTVILPVGFVVAYTFVTTPYTLDGGASEAFYYASETLHSSLDNALGTFYSVLDQATDQVVICLVETKNTYVYFGVDNQPVLLAEEPTDSNPSLGDGTLDITSWFTVTTL